MALDSNACDGFPPHPVACIPNPNPTKNPNPNFDDGNVISIINDVKISSICEGLLNGHQPPNGRYIHYPHIVYEAFLQYGV